MRTTRLSGLVLVVLCGCGVEELVDSRELPVVNGVEDPGHPAVGLVVAKLMMCTGTLVGPRTVLTAAHCLQEQAPYEFRLGDKTYKATKVIPHPDFAEVDSLPELPNVKWKFSVHDLGVALLAEQVQGIEPMKLATQPPVIGQPITVVGFGKTDPKNQYGGKKHKGENVVGSVGAAFVLYGTLGGMKGTSTMTCFGDSGGPVLVLEDGVERILGVHSIVNCVSYNLAARVAPYLDWLAEKSEGNLGAALDLTAPEVLFESPELDAIRPPDFEVIVKITEAGGLESAALYLDGKEQLTTDQLRFRHAVSGLSLGDHELKVVAIDRAGNRAEMIRSVRIQARAEPEKTPVSDEVSLDPEPEASGCSLGAQGRADPSLLLVLALLLVLRRRGRC